MQPTQLCAYVIDYFCILFLVRIYKFSLYNEKLYERKVKIHVEH